MSYKRSIFEYDISHRAVTVYMYLNQRAGIKDVCFPSVGRIARDLSISKRTVYRALDELEKLNLISRTERWTVNGGQSSTLYKLEGKVNEQRKQIKI